MTIPQLCTAIGWGMFVLAGGFTALHAFNMSNKENFFIPSQWIGIVGFIIAIPLLIIGLVLGFIGLFGEQIQQRRAENFRVEDRTRKRKKKV